MKKKKFISIDSFNFKDYLKILKLSFFFDRVKITNFLLNKRVAIIFDSPSTRTRISTEIALKEMGANILFINEKDLQTTNGERNKENCKVLSKYFDLVLIRTKYKKKMDDYKKYITCALINSLDIKEHPCQVFNDIYTCYKENIFLENRNVGWIGRKNNMFNSWLKASKIFKFKLLVFMPKKEKKKIKKVYKKNIFFCKKKYILEKSDILNTDTWKSIGDKNKKKFPKLKIRKKMFKKTKKNFRFMHCLPAYIGKEVDSGSIYHKKSLIFKQVLNKICTIKAILYYVLIGCM
ncbi:hypothetical protein ACWNX6_00455 [Candidatus Vidania fulgoroideorum]